MTQLTDLFTDEFKEWFDREYSNEAISFAIQQNKSHDGCCGGIYRGPITPITSITKVSGK